MWKWCFWVLSYIFFICCQTHILVFELEHPINIDPSALEPSSWLFFASASSPFIPLFNNVSVCFLHEKLQTKKTHIWTELLSAVSVQRGMLVALFCMSRWVICWGWLGRALIWFESWIERKRVSQRKELIFRWIATDMLPGHWIRWNSCPVIIAIIAHNVLE